MILLSLIFSVAQAFTLTSSTDPNMEGWSSPDVTFYLNPAGCPAGVDIEGVIGDAMKVWNAIPTSKINVSYGGTTTLTTHSSPPTIVCSASLGQGIAGTGSVRYVGSAIATGLLTLNSSAGGIATFDTTVLKIVLAHEIGHVLGLGHSDDTNALMYYTVGSKENLTLAQDDIDGMTYLYPRDELSSEKPLGCATVATLGSGQGPKPKSGLLLMLLPLLLAFILRLKQQAPQRKIEALV